MCVQLVSFHYRPKTNFQTRPMSQMLSWKLVNSEIGVVVMMYHAPMLSSAGNPPWWLLQVGDNRDKGQGERRDELGQNGWEKRKAKPRDGEAENVKVPLTGTLWCRPPGKMLEDLVCGIGPT